MAVEDCGIERRCQVEMIIDELDIMEKMIEQMGQELFQKEVEEKRVLAENGDGEAACDLASYYIIGGKGLEQDYAQAKHYCEIAIKSNSIYAKYLMGVVLENTATNQTESKKAYAYLEEAAEQNYAPALFAVAELYRQGNLKSLFGKKKMFSYYKQAAEDCFVSAQYQLASCYYLGEGTKKNLELFEFWLCCAYMNGKEEATNDLNYLLQNGYFSEKEAIERIIKNIEVNYSRYLL